MNVDWFFLSHRLPLALEGIKRGYEVTLFSVDTGKRSIIESYGIRFIDLHFHRSNFNLVQELKSFLTLYKHYRSEKPEIVHHVTLKAIFLGTIVARLAGINNVINAFSVATELPNGIINFEFFSVVPLTVIFVFCSVPAIMAFPVA